MDVGFFQDLIYELSFSWSSMSYINKHLNDWWKKTDHNFYDWSQNDWLQKFKEGF